MQNIFIYDDSCSMNTDIPGTTLTRWDLLCSIVKIIADLSVCYLWNRPEHLMNETRNTQTAHVMFFICSDFFFGNRAFIDMIDFTCVQVSRQGEKRLKRESI